LPNTIDSAAGESFSVQKTIGNQEKAGRGYSAARKVFDVS
jgi:hypothetical protein